MTNRLRRICVPLCLVLLFIATRAAIVCLFLANPDTQFVANDVSYYAHYLFRLLTNGEQVMGEYPPPAVWLLSLLYQLGGGWQTWQPVLYGALFVLDAAVAWSLYRRGHPQGSVFWMLFTGANGSIMWFRFDLIPAALVAWACVLIASHPRIAGALVGLGASIKLWPALLILPMSAPGWRDKAARRRVIGFLVAGTALAITSIAIEGWHRNLQPLTWQSERGLQIESVPATLIMLIRTYTDTPAWTIQLSQYNALELFGPGVEAMVTLSTVLTVLSIVVTIFLTWVLIRRRATSIEILLAVLAVVLMTVIVNKTLSPQYVLWLGGPLAALLMLETPRVLRRHLTVIAVTLVIVGGLTQYTYPWGAYGIMALPLGSGPETSILILRNLLLVILTGYTIWLTLAATRHPLKCPSPRTIG